VVIGKITTDKTHRAVTRRWLSFLFLEPPTFEGMQQTSSQMKKLCISQVSVVTFSGVVAKWVTVRFSF